HRVRAEIGGHRLLFQHLHVALQLRLEDAQNGTGAGRVHAARARALDSAQEDDGRSLLEYLHIGTISLVGGYSRSYHPHTHHIPRSLLGGHMKIKTLFAAACVCIPAVVVYGPGPHAAPAPPTTPRHPAITGLAAP